MEIEFLTVEDVEAIQSLQIGSTGGQQGTRDRALLESAVMQPRMMFGGQYLHEDLFAMAAAYLFHIVKNHPFVDGNKRAGLVAALTFLVVNGIPLTTPSERFEEVTLGVAEGTVDKQGVARTFRELAGGASSENPPAGS